MAKAESVVVQTITLELTVVEALFIKGLVQNSIWGDDPSNEPDGEKELRNAIFTALHKISLIQL